MAYSITSAEPIKINLAPKTLIEEIIQNVSMILQTIKYTAPLYREFGISARYVDKPMQIAETLLISEIYAAIEKYEPRAQIVNISFDHDEKTGKLNPRLEVEINVEQ